MCENRLILHKHMDKIWGLTFLTYPVGLHVINSLMATAHWP